MVVLAGGLVNGLEEGYGYGAGAYMGADGGADGVNGQFALGVASPQCRAVLDILLEHRIRKARIAERLGHVIIKYTYEGGSSNILRSAFSPLSFIF